MQKVISLRLDGEGESFRTRGMLVKLTWLAVWFGCVLGIDASEEERILELDAYWEEVSKVVANGDWEKYKDACHPEAVLVSGSKEKSLPMRDILVRWKSEFDATKAGTRSSKVDFRFSHRYGDEQTAHEAGVFVYSFGVEGEEVKREYVHFEALLVKKEGRWLLMMEYQKSIATKEEWEKLK